MLGKGVPLEKDDRGIETTMGLGWLVTGIRPGDEDHDRELRRQQRRKERRDRELAAQKHTSTDSTNSASQLLSADALAKLNDYHERERTKTKNQRDDDDHNERKERRRQRTRDIAAVEDEDNRIRVEKRRERRRPPSQQPGRRASYRKERRHSMKTIMMPSLFHVTIKDVDSSRAP